MEFKQDKLFSSIANLAVQSLLDEVKLTPKPGLVDEDDTGSHNDLTFDMMKDSANSLKDTFYNIAKSSYNRFPSQALREDIAEIGRIGEQNMFAITNGINTHKGAIWALGLLVSANAAGAGRFTAKETLSMAGQIARFTDRSVETTKETNGKRVKSKYGVNGAKEQAEQGFPHILNYGLPALYYARKINMSENDARKYTLLSLIAHLDDTCILHRGGMEGLLFAQQEAMKLVINKNVNHISTLNKAFIEHNISPGGSADLLAATIFLDELCNIQTLE